MSLVQSLFNTLVLPFILVWRMAKIVYRPIAYTVWLCMVPVRVSYSTIIWPARQFINFLLYFDTLIPAVFLLALVGALTGLALHGLNVLLIRFLRVSPQDKPDNTPQITTPKPRSVAPLSPFILPASPVQMPMPSGAWSPTKTADYKAQMRTLMAQRQDQLLAMHEEDKRRRMVREASVRRRQERQQQQQHVSQQAQMQYHKPKLSVSTQTYPGQGVPPLYKYDTGHGMENNKAGRNSASMKSVGLGLGGVNPVNDLRNNNYISPLATPGGGNEFLYNDIIMEEEEDSDF